MPQMNNTLTGWELPIELIRIRQNIIDGELSDENEEFIQFKGVIQPAKDENLSIDSNGQRSWQYLWIHARASELNLDTADKVVFKGIRYKVISKKDYGLNAFVEYKLCRDYEHEYIN